MELPDDIIELIASKLDYVDTLSFSNSNKCIRNIVKSYIKRNYVVNVQSITDNGGCIRNIVLIKGDQKVIYSKYTSSNKERYKISLLNGEFHGLSYIKQYYRYELFHKTYFVHEHGIINRCIVVLYGLIQIYYKDVVYEIYDILDDKEFIDNSVNAKKLNQYLQHNNIKYRTINESQLYTYGILEVYLNESK